MNQKKVIGLIIILICGFLISCRKERLGPGESLYEHERYQLVLKEGWSITDAPYSKVSKVLNCNDIPIAIIEIAIMDFSYSDIDGLVRYWIGMRARIQEQQEIEITDGDGLLFKLEIAWEESFAQTMQGIPPWPNELHYLFIFNNGLLIDAKIQGINTDTAILEELESILMTIESLE